MDPQTMQTDLLSEPAKLNTSHTSRAIIQLYTLLNLHTLYSYYKNTHRATTPQAAAAFGSVGLYLRLLQLLQLLFFW
jgi:hypothetical protein